MCDLIKTYSKKTFTGYKIVARKKRTKKLYSIATGIEYPQDGKITVPEKQHRITSHFCDNILESTFAGFREEMVGRTAAFVCFIDAKCMFSIIDRQTKEEEFVRKNYAIELWRICLSSALMQGEYGRDPVVAGRHIKFLKKMRG